MTRLSLCACVVTIAALGFAQETHAQSGGVKGALEEAFDEEKAPTPAGEPGEEDVPGTEPNDPTGSCPTCGNGAGSAGASCPDGSCGGIGSGVGGGAAGGAGGGAGGGSLLEKLLMSVLDQVPGLLSQLFQGGGGGGGGGQPGGPGGGLAGGPQVDLPLGSPAGGSSSGSFATPAGGSEGLPVDSSDRDMTPYINALDNTPEGRRILSDLVEDNDDGTYTVRLPGVDEEVTINEDDLASAAEPEAEDPAETSADDPANSNLSEVLDSAGDPAEGEGESGDGETEGEDSSGLGGGPGGTSRARGRPDRAPELIKRALDKVRNKNKNKAEADPLEAILGRGAKVHKTDTMTPAMILELLRRAEKEGLPVVLSSRGTKILPRHDPTALVGNHTYTFAGESKRRAGRFKLQNPWATQHPSAPLTPEKIKTYFDTIEIVEWKNK